MAHTVRRSGVKEVPLSEIKDDLSRFLREAETHEIVITRHGKPAGVLIGFESEEDWFDQRIEKTRNSRRAGGNQTGGCRNGVAPRGPVRRSIPASRRERGWAQRRPRVRRRRVHCGGPGMRPLKPPKQKR